MHGDRNNYNLFIANAVSSVDEVEMDNENDNTFSAAGSGVINLSNGSSLATASYNPDFEINNPSIDLDMYVSGFTGLMRVNRLIFLADHCPPLRIDALRLALNFIIETFNSQLYIAVHKQLTESFTKL